jgi:hypothetical protein
LAHSQAWHRAHPAAANGALVRGGDGQWTLALAARRCILAGCIYGVDRDPRAVALTRRALRLELAAGLDGVDEAALPDLMGQLRCGDSLIGPDYAGPGQEASERPVDWAAAFPEAAGGFDAVIGNPPYVAYYGREASSPPPAVVGRYLAARYGAGMAGWRNTYLMFLLQGLRLVRRGGYLAMIVPDTLAINDAYGETRRVLVEAGLERVARLDFGAFGETKVRTVVPSGVGPERGRRSSSRIYASA